MILTDHTFRAVLPARSCLQQLITSYRELEAEPNINPEKVEERFLAAYIIQNSFY